MGNILFEYLLQKYREEEQTTETRELPFVTISRQHGCRAGIIAGKVVELMNENLPGSLPRWEYISKEILERAAEELNTDAGRVRKTFQMKWQSTIQETLESFIDQSFRYDLHVMQSIRKVISDFAARGHVVIVGRGGLESTYKQKNGLHISLTAPLPWRVKQVMQNENITQVSKAQEHIRFTDAEREKFRKRLGNSVSAGRIYDITYNCAALDADDIAASIVFHLKRIRK